MPRKKVLSQSRQAIVRRSLKKSNFNKWKSSSLRNSWLARAGKLKIDKELVPTRQQIEDWLSSQMPFICYYTGENLGVNFEADHKIPVSRGGSFDLKNICLTSPLLNGAKGTLTDKEFVQLLKVILKWDDAGKSLLKRLRASRF